MRSGGQGEVENVDSALALIIIALRAKAVDNAVDHLQPKAVTVVTPQEILRDLPDVISAAREVGMGPEANSASNSAPYGCGRGWQGTAEDWR